MKTLIPFAAALAFALVACGEPTDTTPEPAVEADTTVVDGDTVVETVDPAAEEDGATISVTEDGVGVDANVPVTDDVTVDVDADSN